MNIKENINDYNLNDFATCKNLVYELHNQNKSLTKNVNFYNDLLATKSCTKHHWFSDIDKAYDTFNNKLDNDKEFRSIWYREKVASPFEIGVYSTTNQLRAFFKWYVDVYGGEAIPF